MGSIEIQLPSGCLREDATCTASEAITRERIPVKCDENMGPLGKCGAAAVVRFRNSTMSEVTTNASESSCLKAITSKTKDAPQSGGNQGGGGGKGNKKRWW